MAASKSFSGIKSVVFSFCLPRQQLLIINKCHGKVSILRHAKQQYCTSVQTQEIQVTYRNGLPAFAVPLPSRREQCLFTFKPLSDTVGDLCDRLQQEDKGIDRVVAYNTDGVRLARSTPIDVLLQSDFRLSVNDGNYLVQAPPRENDQLQVASDLKQTIAQLYNALNIEQYQLKKEAELKARLEQLHEQMAPLEKIKQEIEVKAAKKTSAMSWVGLGLMGLQFGILARLTWWEYSWDIMEPVTYFVTYGTTMAMYSYYVLTRQEYCFPEVRDREFLSTVHKHAKSLNLDISNYNRLRESISQIEYDLQRLRDPLQLQLPIKHLEKRAVPEASTHRSQH